MGVPMNGPTRSAHKGTVGERMIALAKLAGVRPEDLFTMTVIEFAARVAERRASVVEVPQ